MPPIRRQQLSRNPAELELFPARRTRLADPGNLLRDDGFRLDDGEVVLLEEGQVDPGWGDPTSKRRFEEGYVGEEGEREGWNLGLSGEEVV